MINWIWKTRIAFFRDLQLGCRLCCLLYTSCVNTGCDFGSLQVSLPAVFVSSRNALPKNSCEGDYRERKKFINLCFGKPSASLREELWKILYKEEMSKIQLFQPLMHTNLFFSCTLFISMPLSRPFKQEENLFKRKEHRHHCILFRHYRDRRNSPNLRRTTHETLDLKKRGGDRRKLTRQALGTVNYNRHYNTIFQVHATQLLLTGLAGE